MVTVTLFKDKATIVKLDSVDALLSAATLPSLLIINQSALTQAVQDRFKSIPIIMTHSNKLKPELAAMPNVTPLAMPMDIENLANLIKQILGKI